MNFTNTRISNFGCRVFFTCHMWHDMPFLQGPPRHNTAHHRVHPGLHPSHESLDSPEPQSSVCVPCSVLTSVPSLRRIERDESFCRFFLLFVYSRLFQGPQNIAQDCCIEPIRRAQFGNLTWRGPRARSKRQPGSLNKNQLMNIIITPRG